MCNEERMAEIIKALPTSILIMFAIAIIVIVAGLAVGVFFLVRSIIKKGVRVKVGSQEYGFNTGENSASTTVSAKREDKIEQESQKEIMNTSSSSFISVITSVINYSISSAYEAVTLRQRLFSDHVRNAKSKFSMVKTLIIGDYIKGLKNVNVDFIDIVLESLIDSTILIRLEKAFQADRFAEKTKDQILDLYKPFIESAYSDFKIELTKLMRDIDDKGTHLIQSKMLDCVDSQKDLIKKSITECFEYAYNESVNYVKELEELSTRHGDQINNSLKSYFTSNQEIVNSLPKIWNEMTPPNSVVGEGNG